jgi:hypothetical protein
MGIWSLFVFFISLLDDAYFLSAVFDLIAQSLIVLELQVRREAYVG